MDGRHARKEINRQRLIEAAFRLFQSGGEDALTMRALAAEAGVSDATPYNLFGNKAGILIAMFDSMLDGLPKRKETDQGHNALERFLGVTDNVVNLWAEPSGLFCTMMAAIQRSGQRPPQLIDRPLREIGAAMRRLYQDGWLGDIIPSEAVAARIAHGNAGLFGLWQGGSLSKDQLSTELKLNALLPILSAASDARRKEISEVLQQVLLEAQSDRAIETASTV